jgi:hypothetical protein
VREAVAEREGEAMVAGLGGEDVDSSPDQRPTGGAKRRS